MNSLLGKQILFPITKAAPRAHPRLFTRANSQLQHQNKDNNNNKAVDHGRDNRDHRMSRWNRRNDFPFVPVRFNRVMDEMFDNWQKSLDSTWPEPFAELENWEGKGAWNPKTHITTKDNNVIVTAEMPGLAKEDVSVDLTDGVLTIKGEKKSEEDKDGTHYRSSRSYFKRFTVDDGADPAQVKAKMEHGVLKVTVPLPQAKAEKSSPIAIE